jgi:hypothetical protein
VIKPAWQNTIFSSATAADAAAIASDTTRHTPTSGHPISDDILMSFLLRW